MQSGIHSDHVPAPDPDAVQKRSDRLTLLARGHVITGTFFIYPSGEAVAYLGAAEPRWVPLVDVRIRSRVDRRIKMSAAFAVFNRKAVVATAVG